MSKAPDSLNNAPEISITLRETKETLTGWSGFQVIRSIDAAADAFAFNIPFDPTEENKKRFLPYSPGIIEIKGGDEIFLLGYFEKVGAVSSSGDRSLTIEGRSASGALVDWSAGSLWNRGSQSFETDNAFEMSGITAGDIASRLAAAHMVYFQPDTPVIDELSIEPGQTIFRVLSKLAASNGYFGVPQPDGSLIFRNDLGNTAPVADIIEGTSPVISVATNHDVTKRFWKYKVIAATTGSPDVSAEAIDSELAPAIRGIRIVQPEQQSTDYTKTARMARAQGLIDSYGVTAVINGFAYNDRAGAWQFWKAGDVVSVLAPGAMIYKKTSLIVKQVKFSLDETGGQISTLNLAFPELYSGGFPEDFPWDV